MWSRLRKKLFIHRTGVAERTRPIPKPTHFPGVIYHSKRQGVITLQEQMCLEDDKMTFLEFTVCHETTLLYSIYLSESQRLMKQTMDNHLNIGMSYKWQDPGLLEEVREEVGVHRVLKRSRNGHRSNTGARAMSCSRREI